MAGSAKVAMDFCVPMARPGIGGVDLLFARFQVKRVGSCLTTNV